MPGGCLDTRAECHLGIRVECCIGVRALRENVKYCDKRLNVTCVYRRMLE